MTVVIPIAEAIMSVMVKLLPRIKEPALIANRRLVGRIDAAVSHLGFGIFSDGKCCIY